MVLTKAERDAIIDGIFAKTVEDAETRKIKMIAEAAFKQCVDNNEDIADMAARLKEAMK